MQAYPFPTRKNECLWVSKPFLSPDIHATALVGMVGSRSMLKSIYYILGLTTERMYNILGHL